MVVDFVDKAEYLLAELISESFPGWYFASGQRIGCFGSICHDQVSC